MRIGLRLTHSPIGVATRWFRSVASGLPTITKVGLGTFLDPRRMVFT
ncbi:hypothetical protein [Vulcanisaeta distributa]|nr:hypothetical protein [Vulcanisaeta distributa]